MLKLTEEGKKYLEKGLPEKRLMAALGKPAQIRELQKLEDFPIGLQWAKKNGWIRIEKGTVFPLRKPGPLAEEEALKAVAGGKQPGRMLSVLLQRRLVKEEREDERKRAEAFLGKEVDRLSPELIKTGLWEKVKLKPYNVEFVGRTIHPGKRQPYNQFLEKVRRRLVELGFRELRGQAVIQEFWNFDALFQAQNHPSRDWTETYSLKHPKKGSLPNPALVQKVRETHENGWKTGSTGWGYTWDPAKAVQLMPIAHDTAISPKILSSKDLQVPGKYFQIVRCFRPDVLDATHLIEFNQTGGFVVGEGLNLRNLLGLLEVFAKEFAGATEVRFKPDYFPFTEPSLELSAKHPKMGWMELGGAGIFREELTKPLGVEHPVIAWGIGIDRLAMFKLGIKDIRQLFSTDLKWLRERGMV